ncbi:MAG: protein-methionine-sulfoxide reductase catalytic subunit MsrP [Gemmatimonadetes bacterium]|nr:protein-methionine-sulfoxide reductase catalytic subunit MsrP [Gemmatimonadota bacterium]
MIIRIRNNSDIPSSEITPESAYINRRKFLGASAGIGAAAFLARGAAAAPSGAPAHAAHLAARQDEEPNTFEEITSYNNFYEFGLDKKDPSKYAPSRLVTEPWTVKVDGLCNNPADYQLEDFIKPSTIEDRTYRLRCVEAWSMVVPWRGFPLADVIRRAEPTAAAKYVSFATLWDPEQMPERRWRPVIDWPYREGLRLDEALHPLSLLVTGLYGKDLPAQNGAPLRLIVPWKYGFKSIKSIVGITFTEDEPPTTWATQSPREYGFYSNVNPDVSHPRWSQATEKRIDSSKLFGYRRIDTQFLNGYADEVAHMYEGMDLQKHF